MLSILGGEWGGRKLQVPDSERLRPTSGRVKAAIFSIIEALEWKRQGSPPDYSHWRCVDLFAGVGGLGLEMLSRGAKECVFVEKDRRHAGLLQKNIEALGCEARCTVMVDDVAKGKWPERGPFDLALLDPPYADSHLPLLLERIQSALSPGGIVVFEHDPKVKFGEISNLELHSHRVLGPAGISVFLRPR